MTDQYVIQVIRDAFYQVILIVGPLLLASLVVGLLISIFQAATSISEQTLTFVPKLIVVFVLVVLLLPYIISTLKSYTLEIFNMITQLR